MFAVSSSNSQGGNSCPILQSGHFLCLSDKAARHRGLPERMAKPCEGLDNGSAGCRFLCPQSKTSRMNKNESPAQAKTEQLVFIENDTPITTSRLIARTFGKQHAHVLRDLQNLGCSEEFGESNFGLSSYITSQGKELPEYHITKDGFTMLAFGYTGEKAMKFKEAYINRFNEMDKELRQRMYHHPKLAQNAGYHEGQVFITKLGYTSIKGYYTKGVLYFHLNTIMRHFGFNYSGGHLYANKFGEGKSVKVSENKQESWFVNMEWVDAFLASKASGHIVYSDITTLYRDLFKIERGDAGTSPYTYHFADTEILEIIYQVKQFRQKPSLVLAIIDKLMQGGGRK